MADDERPVRFRIRFPVQAAGGAGGGGTLTAAEIVALLSSLTGDARLPVSAVKLLAGYGITISGDTISFAPGIFLDTEDTFYSYQSDGSGNIAAALLWSLRTSAGATLSGWGGSDFVWSTVPASGRIYITNLQGDHVTSYGVAGTKTAHELASGDQVVIQPWGTAAGEDRDAALTLTISSGPTAGGSGEGAYKWYSYSARVLDSGFATPGNGVFRISDTMRSKIHIPLSDIYPTPLTPKHATGNFQTNDMIVHDTQQGDLWVPFSAVVDALANYFVRVTGTNVTGALRDAVQVFNEPQDFTGDYTRKAAIAAAGEWAVNITPPFLGAGNTAQLEFWPKAADAGHFDSHWIVGAQVQFGDVPNDYVLQIIDGVDAIGGYWLAGVQRLSGTLPANNSSSSVEMRGFDPHRTEFVAQVWRDHTDNIAGRGGAAGEVWLRGSSATDAGWGDLPASLSVVATATDITGTYADISTRTYAATEIVTVTLRGTGTETGTNPDRYWALGPILVGDIPTGGVGIGPWGQGGGRIEVQLSSDKLQIRRAGQVDSSNVVKVFLHR